MAGLRGGNVMVEAAHYAAAVMGWVMERHCLCLYMVSGFLVAGTRKGVV